MRKLSIDPGRLAHVCRASDAARGVVREATEAVNAAARRRSSLQQRLNDIPTRNAAQPTLLAEFDAASAELRRLRAELDAAQEIATAAGEILNSATRYAEQKS